MNALTEHKTADIEKRTDYKRTGHVLSDDYGQVCIVHHGAVRWLSSDEMWELMHPCTLPKSFPIDSEPSN